MCVETQLIFQMNVTYIRNVYERPVVFTDFTNEMWSILIISILILTRGVVSSLLKMIKGDEGVHHHVHYSNEYSTADLNLDLNPKPLNPKPSGSGDYQPKSEFDPYEGFRPPHNSPILKKPKEPKRDELV